MAKIKGVHDGHRDRVRDKFLHSGLEVFEEHQILELLLFYGIPRKDTNEIAHKLINTYGSFSSVFDAPIETLEDCGLSKSASVLIKLIPQVCRKYMDDKYENKDKIITSENIAERLMPKFIGLDEENVVLMLLDAKSKELYCGVISQGSVNASEIYTRKVVQLAVKYHSTSAIISHNHPSGIALPSLEDIKSTINLKKALSAVGVRLVDHIIVADTDYISLAQSEEHFKIFM